MTTPDPAALIAEAQEMLEARKVGLRQISEMSGPVVAASLDLVPFVEGQSHISELIERLLAALTETQAALRASKQKLAEYYRLSGADPDGNEDWRLAEHAVEEVARLRRESDASEAARQAAEHDDWGGDFDGLIAKTDALLADAGRYHFCPTVLIEQLRQACVFEREMRKVESIEAEAERDALRQEFERLQRTVEFQEKSYLAEHGHWGDCKFRLELAALRARLTLTEAEQAQVRGAKATISQGVQFTEAIWNDLEEVLAILDRLTGGVESA